MIREEFLSVWTVYDHPSDYPDSFVARRFEVSDRVNVTRDVLLSKDLHVLRKNLLHRGLVKFNRNPSDDPKIVETWL